MSALLASAPVQAFGAADANGLAIPALIAPLVAPILSQLPGELPQLADAALQAASAHQTRDVDATILHWATELTPLAAAALTGEAGVALTARVERTVAAAQRLVADTRHVCQLESAGWSVLDELRGQLLQLAHQCAAEILQAVTDTALTQGFGAGLIGMQARAFAIAQRYYEQAQTHLSRADGQLMDIATSLEQVHTRASDEVGARSSLTGVQAGDEPHALGSSSLPSAAPATEYAQELASSADASTATAPTPQAQAAVHAAKQALGTPYVWGGNTPGVGLDCSGLTYWAYQQAGVDIPRVAEAQTVGSQVSRDQVLPGDLVVWDGHVAMVIDQHTMIEAGDPVQMNPIRETNVGMQFKGYFRPTG